MEYAKRCARCFMQNTPKKYWAKFVPTQCWKQIAYRVCVWMESVAVWAFRSYVQRKGNNMWNVNYASGVSVRHVAFHRSWGVRWWNRAPYEGIRLLLMIWNHSPFRLDRRAIHSCVIWACNTDCNFFRDDFLRRMQNEFGAKLFHANNDKNKQKSFFFVIHCEQEIRSICRHIQWPLCQSIPLNIDINKVIHKKKREKERTESHRVRCWRRICCVETVNKSFRKRNIAPLNRPKKERHLDEHLNIVPPARVPVCACQQRKMSKQSVDVHRQIYWIIKSKRTKKGPNRNRQCRKAKLYPFKVKQNKIRNQINGNYAEQTVLNLSRARALTRATNRAHNTLISLKIVDCY